MVSVQVKKSPIHMEVDTGAALSLINEETFSKIKTGDSHLEPTTITLKTYTAESVQLLGVMEVDVTYESQQASLPVVVVKGTGPNLLGRDWLRYLQLQWADICHIDHTSVDDVLQQHSNAK